MIQNPTLDQKYSDLVDQLGNQNALFGAFLNGGPDDVVNLSGGRSVKSLSGVIADLNRFKYVQKIVDQRLYSDMIAADATIENGILTRVWGDTTQVNGLYLKVSTGTYSKISYQTVYDLKDFLPDPWNYLQIQYDPTVTSLGAGLVQFALPSSVTQVNDIALKGSYKYTIDTTNYRGTIHGELTILISALDPTHVSATIQNHRLVGAIDPGLSSLVTLENIRVQRMSDANTHNFIVTFIPPVDPSANPIAGFLDFRLNGVDLNIVSQVTTPATLTFIPPTGFTGSLATYNDAKV